MAFTKRPGRAELHWGVTSLVVAFAAIPGLVLWCLTITSLSLIVLSLGIPATLLACAGIRRYADRYRQWVGQFTGVPILRPYRQLPETGWLPMFRALVRDPATWRDLAWLLVNMTAGFALALVPGAFLLATCWYLALPLVFLILGSDVLRLDFVLFTIHDLPTGFFGWLLAAACFGLLRLTGQPALQLFAGLTRLLLAPTKHARLGQRVTDLAKSRSETIDTQAAELRRIERDLHDGAQARLVSLGMNLGMAEQLLATEPEAAAALLGEAMKSNAIALSELRDLVRGIHPPVLADRGLEGAIHAAALTSAIPVQVTVELPGRPPAPVESALYFAVVEAVANLIKHSHATEGWIRMTHSGGAIQVQVGDNGTGGAAVTEGGGLHGIERRLAAFDGTVFVSSPLGGPTIVTMELPCALSSEKTSPSSGTA
jgi:signal transduction histidine kinase